MPLLYYIYLHYFMKFVCEKISRDNWKICDETDVLQVLQCNKSDINEAKYHNSLIWKLFYS